MILIGQFFAVGSQGGYVIENLHEKLSDQYVSTVMRDTYDFGHM